MTGLPYCGPQSMPGRSDPPVKPTSEVAHRPCLIDWPAFDLDPPTPGPCHLRGVWIVRQGCIHEHITEARVCSLHLAIMRTYEPFDNWGCARCLPLQVRAPLIVDQADPRAKRGCGGVQHREIKSAGQTTGGACGGTRLGNPCDEHGLTR